MAFNHFELIFTVVSHVEMRGSQLRALGRLASRSPTSETGWFEFVEKTQGGVGAGSNPVWEETQRDVNAEAFAKVAECAARIWDGGKTPRIQCEGTAEEAWFVLHLRVASHDKHWNLSLEPTDGLGGPDAEAVRDLLRALCEACGVTPVQLGDPAGV